MMHVVRQQKAARTQTEGRRLLRCVGCDTGQNLEPDLHRSLYLQYRVDVEEEYKSPLIERLGTDLDH